MSSVSIIYYLLLTCLSNSQDQANEVDELYKLVTSIDATQRIKACEITYTMIQTRQSICNKMEMILKNNSEGFNGKDTSNKIALYILANHVDYDSPRSQISLLVNHVDVRFDRPKSGSGFNRIDRAFPAIRGLLLIGQPATEIVIDKIKTTDDPGSLGRFAFWFCKQYGQKQAIRIFNDILDENPKTLSKERKRLVYVLERIELNTW